MAFIVKKNDEPRIVRNWPVIVQTAQDGGKVSKDEITVDYEVLAQSEVDEIIQTAHQAGENADIALLRRSVKTINGQVDEANSPIAFDEDSFADALNRTNQRGAMVAAFFDVQNGRKAARKNS